MKHLLNLFAAVALLVWGTYLVRTGILRTFGAGLRQWLAGGMASRPAAAVAGFGVTALVQSSTATALIVSAFVGQGLVSLGTALAVMLGADIGTSLMAVVFSFDLSWFSPLAILVGVVLFITRKATPAGHLGRALIGLGLMLLALRLIGESTEVIVRGPAVRAVLGTLGSDILLEITVGALLTVLAYSSLAVVLLTATLAGAGVVPLDVALGLTLGANLGSGVLAVLATANSPVEVRQVPAGNLVFKGAGVLVAAPLLGLTLQLLQPHLPAPATAVVLYHLLFNVLVAAAFLGFTHVLARRVERWLPKRDGSVAGGRPHHLDPAALGTPSLAISNAARQAMHQADVVELMLAGTLRVIRGNDLRLAQELRKMGDTVDQLCSAIKYYLTRIPRAVLDPGERRRWDDIIGFAINMEQVGDIVERVLKDVEEKKIRKGREFSDAGMAEISELHARLLDNLRLGMSVFLNGSASDARRLLEEKARFRELERAYAATHLARLAENTVQSLETSSLHLDLIRELRRVNSHLCSIAYPVLKAAAPADAAEPADLAADAVPYGA